MTEMLQNSRNSALLCMGSVVFLSHVIFVFIEGN